MTDHRISVSTVAFDGHPLDVAFAEISRLGFPLVEPAYIKGYMDFGEEDFSETASRQMESRFKAHGLSAIAISAHMDNGHPDATEMLARRMRFAAAIGAGFVITNSTTVARRQNLERTLSANLPLAERLGVIIALENPGNGPDNLMRDGREGAALVASFASPQLCFNYDTANALTCTEGDVRPDRDVEQALSQARHMHLKDVVRDNGAWRYTAIGSGEIDYGVLLRKLARHPDIPLTLELPLRLRRAFHGEPERTKAIPDIPSITAAIISSRERVQAGLAAAR